MDSRFIDISEQDIESFTEGIIGWFTTKDTTYDITTDPISIIPISEMGNVVRIANGLIVTQDGEQEFGAYTCVESGTNNVDNVPISISGNDLICGDCSLRIVKTDRMFDTEMLLIMKTMLEKYDMRDYDGMYQLMKLLKDKDANVLRQNVQRVSINNHEIIKVICWDM